MKSSPVSVATLQQAHGGIVDAVAGRLASRRASVFEALGEEACRGFVETSLEALEHDLEAGKRESVRKAVYALMDEIAEHNPGFTDVRAYVRFLREEVREVLAEAAAELRAKVEEWFFDLLMVFTIRFMAWRDESLQAELARRSVDRLESQLAELEVALQEKTELLDIVRQASTPIAPVVRGILVVPLVGTFDAFRAELLTEKLLQEISRSQARVVILDITGVPVFDTTAAQLMIRLARSVRMLGTEVILVGMSADNARTVVDLGIDLSDVRTCGTLQDGLVQALELKRSKYAAY